MSCKILLWVDDDYSGRQTKLEAVAEALGLKLVCVEKSNSDKNWFDSLSRCVKNNRLVNKAVSVIVIDYYLSSQDPNSPVFDKGASLCSVLRILFPDVPILGVSNASKDIIRNDEKKEFAYFVELTRLPSSFSDDSENILKSIKSIVDGYASIRYCKARKRKDALLLELCKVPRLSRDSFDRIIPSMFKSEFTNGIANDIFAWFRGTVLYFQGVLIDSGTAAAMIGAKESYFMDTIQKRLPKNCFYEGVFADLNGKWFWRNELITALRKMVKDDGSIEVSHYIEKFTTDKMKWAKCPNCKKYYTELVSYAERNVTDPLNKRVPAHRRCVVVSEIIPPLFFEPIYILDEGSK